MPSIKSILFVMINNNSFSNLKVILFIDILLHSSYLKDKNKYLDIMI